MPAVVAKKRNIAICLSSCFFAVIMAAVGITSMLSNRLIATQLMSNGLWQSISRLLTSTDLGSANIAASAQFVEISFAKVFVVLAAITIVAGGVGAAWISKRHSIEFNQAAANWYQAVFELLTAFGTSFYMRPVDNLPQSPESTTVFNQCFPPCPRTPS